MIRAIDVNGLIGNIGGYIGLCLGYSILQIPNLASAILGIIKTRLLSVRKTNADVEVPIHVYDGKRKIEIDDILGKDGSKLNDLIQV